MTSFSAASHLPAEPETEPHAGTMTGPLSGRVALVTGAGHGLGRASAIRLAQDGASVVVVDVNGAAARDVAESIGPAARAIEADVSTQDGSRGYLRLALDAFGRIDLYHFNAGIFGSPFRLTDVPIEEFDRVMQVNVRGSFLGLQAAFTQFEAQRDGGAIVLTASIAGLRGSADLIPYQASKHAIDGLMQGAAVYGGPLGVRVNSVAPGLVPTAADAALNADMIARGATVPLRRAGTAEEIAAVVAFLLSDSAAYITGQTLSADGGASMVNTVRGSGGAGAWDAAGHDRAYYGELLQQTELGPRSDGQSSPRLSACRARARDN
ncbi:SDR family oxidoreductase [soil metagenome]